MDWRFNLSIIGKVRNFMRIDHTRETQIFLSRDPFNRCGFQNRNMKKEAKDKWTGSVHKHNDDTTSSSSVNSIKLFFPTKIIACWN